MLEAPIPDSDNARLEALRALEILDTLPEDRFDRLTRLACRVFGVPIALVSLVDRDRQWFKSRFGLGATETPRNVSFCGHAILGDKIFVVPDATQDARFADNPLVTGDPKVRFYAGAPLSTLGGYKVGTLCVISPEARQFADEEYQLLSDLAAIVEQELISAELAHARDAAMAASTAKSQFLANMSHEIRTPLNAVIGLSELLMSSEMDAESKESVEAISVSGKALLSLISDILDISKIEAGKLELSQDVFSVSEVVDEVVRLTKVLASGKDLAIQVSVGADLPSRVLGDRTRFRQVLTNLAGNAVKFTEKGHVRVSVRNGGMENAVQWMELVVSDTGIGMNEEVRGRIFAQFVQGDSSTARRFGGTGLGLAISRQLVELMGGTIRVESEEGKGTSMHLRIPFKVEAGAAPGAAAAAGTSKARILAVDDNAINLKVILLQLKKLGYEASGASCGEQALKDLRGGGFDLVLMDLQMPGMDGLETTRRLREIEGFASLPVIALTASAFQEDRRECLDAGMTDFLSKPVQIQELKSAIESQLR